MSFESSLLGFLHLLISLVYFTTIAGCLEMKDFLFVGKRSHSNYELVKEFFNRTLLSPCDMTANICDINCCTDPDCEDDDINVFDCSTQTDQRDADPTWSDPYYCYSNSSDFSIDPVFCYENKNSPFLGTYFSDESILKRKILEQQLEILVATSVQKYFVNVEPPPSGVDKIYKYGVPIKLVDESQLTLPVDILGKGYCSSSSSVRYLIDSTSVCTSKMNVDSCETNPAFHLSSYFDKNDDGDLHFKHIHSGKSTNPTKLTVTVLCRPNITEIERHLTLTDIYGDCDDFSRAKTSKMDDALKICKNVVTKIEYNFGWYENYLSTVSVTVVLSDVSVDQPASIIPSRRGASSAVTQIFNVRFVKTHKANHSSQDRSYFLKDRIALHSL